MSRLQSLGIKVFADGADLEGILRLANDPLISGFTTNPTLMRKAGVDDFEGFARKVLDHITDRPISFEVFSDDFDEMRRQALRIGSWGPNVYVKVPVTNTGGETSEALVRELSADGLRLNVTAILSLRQVNTVVAASIDPGRRRVGLCRPDSRYGAGSCPLDVRCAGADEDESQCRAVVGQPTGGAECLPGGGDRVRHHHRDT